MQDLNDLAYFAAVADHGGFAAAGRALDLPKSTLSRRIALLEERLGVRLFQRHSFGWVPFIGTFWTNKQNAVFIDIF